MATSPVATDTLQPTEISNIVVTIDITSQLRVISNLGLKQGWMEKIEEEITNLGLFDLVDISGHVNVVSMFFDGAYAPDQVQDAMKYLDEAIAAFYKKAKRWKK